MSDDAVLAMSMLSSGAGICVLIICAFCCLRLILNSRRANGGGALGKCKPKNKECAYTTRVYENGRWACPNNYEDTGCDWSDGQTLGALQCRACGPNNPYNAYQVTNPNCPEGFKPCNDPAFNWGGAKKGADGEWTYSGGVTDPQYDESSGINPRGGSITLNKGVWGGTEAHPEVFARGCCHWGNSTDDPERDKANATIKKATAGIAWTASIGAFLTTLVGNAAGIAAGLALTAAATGASAAGLIRAPCGGPTELYKQTGKNYYYKGPYKDGKKIRGYNGLWYAANNGCPLVFFQFFPDLKIIKKK